MGSFTRYSDQPPKPKGSAGWVCFVIAIIILAACSFTFGFAARERAIINGHALETRSQLSAFSPAGNRVDVGSRSDQDIRPMQTMIDALRQVRHYFVERIEDSQEKDLTYSSLAKMMESLGDPQSRFLSPEQRELADDALRGKFHGIGAVLGMKTEKNPVPHAVLPTPDNPLTSPGTLPLTAPQPVHTMEGKLIVIAALPGSPAEKAGLQPGDSIIEKDGKWVISYNPIDSAMSMYKGVKNRQIDPAELQKALEAAKKKLENGITIQKAADELTKTDTGTFNLVVVRKGEPKNIKVTLTPGVTEVASVEHKMLVAGTGYIHVNYFGRGTGDAFGEALADLAANKATRLVLDLRNSPGGSTDAALRVAGWLEPRKPYGLLAKAHDAREALTTPDSKKAAADKIEGASADALRKPIVVLVNGGTSSAGEMLAASLRDNGIGVLVGSKTYGDLLQHTMFVLRDGSAVTFTTGKYLTPKGLDYNGKGLKVDVAVAASRDGDAQLEKALAVLKAKSGS
ncbi:MAG: S41 family peptidase [Armatimonadota bacterium]|nr:S41 family peptidase [Armatimonadota bacterium]